MSSQNTALEGFAAYAAAHKLTIEPDGRLPRTTPLLAEGELRSVEALMRGWLGEFLEAQIAIVSREGGAEEAAVDLTVAVTHVPKAKRFVPWLLCHRVEDGHLLGRAVWLRELFSPGFIVFLLELAPKGLAFEYVQGTLCVSQRGRLTLAEDIDGLRDATVELVARIRGEVRERLGEAQGRSGLSGWEN